MKTSTLKQALKKDFTALLAGGGSEYDKRLLKDIKHVLSTMKLPETMKIICEFEDKSKRFKGEVEELLRAFENGRL